MSEIRPRFYVHKDNEKWIIVRMGDNHIVFGSTTYSAPVWQRWCGGHDRDVEDGTWVEITYANMRPPTRELDDLKAGMKEKIRLIEDLRAELDSENLNVQAMDQKLKHLQRDLDEARKTITSLNQGWMDRDNLIDGLRKQVKHLTTPTRQGERPVVRISAVEERINRRLADLENRRQESPVALREMILDVMNSWAEERRITRRIADLETQGAQTVARVSRSDDRLGKRIEKMEKSADETQRIEASRHEALRQRVEKIERVVPPGSGNLQTIVENLADRMAADPKNAFQTYVDQRIQRISSWFDMKVSTLENLINQRIQDHKALEGRVIVTERKIVALEGSDNTLFDDLQNQIDNLKSRTHDNTVDLHNLSARITRLEIKQ